MVDRFTITAAEQDPWIDADPSGQWVRYSDYAALEAQLAERAGGVKVRELEWKTLREGESYAAVGAGITYRLVKAALSSTAWSWYRLEGHQQECESFEVARAAAQADYERRVLSCLSTPEQGETAPSPGSHVEGWTKVPTELPLALLRSINRDNQVLAYENGRYYNAWFEFKASEGGWFWTDDADSEPNPSHYRPLPAKPAVTEGQNNG